ncbi:MAG: hypothetical protein R6U43_05270 [Candidatus Krumholzibacteriales bacterium]
MNTKLFVLIILVLGVAAFYLLPRTRLSGRLKMNEKLFCAVNVIGVICGAAGLALSLAMGGKILTGHYFELILLPAVLVYLYSAMIMKSTGNEAAYDEKQNYNMTQAAALSLPFSVAGMFILYALYRESVFGGMVWFPVYLFLNLTVYSAGVLAFFRKN